MILSENPKENFGELMEEYASHADIQAAKAEKEAGLAEDKPLSLSEILKNYPTKPQRKLDLHGLKAEEAKIKIDSFIRNSREKRLQTVKIVTGKGIHSEEGKSVLRDVAEEKIVELKKEGLILSSVWEHQRKRKSGAMIVYLK